METSAFAKVATAKHGAQLSFSTEANVPRHEAQYKSPDARVELVHTKLSINTTRR